MRVQYWIGAIAAVLCAVCVYSPIFLYFLLFVLYSLVLIAVGKSGTAVEWLVRKKKKKVILVVRSPFLQRCLAPSMCTTS